MCAGRLFQFTCGSPWWVTLPRSKWPHAAERILGAAADAPFHATPTAPPPDDCIWDDVHGDRRQELVCIGVRMNRAAVEAALRGALVTDEEFAAGPTAWEEWDDPFDFFPYEDELDDEEEAEGEGGGTGTPEDAAVVHSVPGVAAAAGEAHGHHVHGAHCSHGHHGDSDDKSGVRRVVTSAGVTMVKKEDTA